MIINCKFCGAGALCFFHKDKYFNLYACENCGKVNYEYLVTRK